MRYRLIKDNLRQFHVSTMCRALEVSRSGFYAWLKGAKSKRAVANDLLLEKIKDTCQEPADLRLMRSP